MKNGKKMSTESMVLAAILTALVVILQFMGSFIRLGPFSISLVLIPIVIGTATCGAGVGAWLGLVFGVVVILSGDAGLFLAVNVPGTIITVLLKGIACGYLAGITYKYALSFMNKRTEKKIESLKKDGALCDECAGKMQKYFSKDNSYISVLSAAVICPLVNTGIFLLGCLLFFMDTISGWATAAGFGENVAEYMIFGLVGGNFVFEFLFNIIISPVIVRLLNIRKK